MTLEEALNDEYILEHCKNKGILVQDIKCFCCLDGEDYGESFALGKVGRDEGSFPECVYYCPEPDCQFSEETYFKNKKKV